MIRQDQDVVVGRIVLRGPGDEVDQGFSGGHVQFTLADQIGANSRQILVGFDDVAPGLGPVAIPAITPAIPVDLGYHVHPVGGADALYFVQIDVDVLLEHLVVRILV